MPRSSLRPFALLAAGAVVVALSGCAGLPAQAGGSSSAPWMPEPSDQLSADAPEHEGAAGLAADDGETDLLVFGDSWTVGLAAEDEDDGYAYLTGELLDWPTVVAGESGSGYLKAGHAGGVYGPRILALDLDETPDVIVIQGSINDRRHDLSLLPRAAESAWDAMAARFPDARIVILGPAPQILPIEPATAEIDRLLAQTAAREGLTYISPIGESWITADVFDAVIDSSPQGAFHPSSEGHAYLAELLAGHLAPLGDETGHQEATVAAST